MFGVWIYKMELLPLVPFVLIQHRNHLKAGGLYLPYSAVTVCLWVEMELSRAKLEAHKMLTQKKPIMLFSVRGSLSLYPPPRLPSSSTLPPGSSSAVAMSCVLICSLPVINRGGKYSMSFAQLVCSPEDRPVKVRWPLSGYLLIRSFYYRGSAVALPSPSPFSGFIPLTWLCLLPDIS